MSNLQITKIKTTRYNIKQIGLDYFTFNEIWRRVRGSARYKGFECYSCNKPFKDGDKISAIFTDKGNKVVCHECGVKINDELEGKAGERI